MIPAEQVKKHVYRIRFVSPTGDSIEIDLFPDYIAIVDRKSFDSMLRDKAKTSGAQLTGGLFINAEKGRKWYSCRIKSRNEELVCRAEYIIAADGVNSRVRLTQGLPLSTAFYTITERMKGVSSDTCEFWFSTSHAQGFYSWAFPSGEGICIGTGSREPGRLRELLDRFRARRGVGAYRAQSRIYKIPEWNDTLYNKERSFFREMLPGTLCRLVLKESIMQ